MPSNFFRLFRGYSLCSYKLEKQEKIVCEHENTKFQ